MVFNKKQLQEDIQIQLGSENLSVELGEKSLDLVVRRTLQIFQRYKPLVVKENYTTPSTGITVHEMPEDCIGIKKVELLPAFNIGLGLYNIESQLLAGSPVFYGTSDTLMDITYLDYRRRWLKTVARELGSEPDYATIKDPDTNITTLYTFCTGVLYVDVEYTTDYKEDLTNTPSYWHKWLSDYALSEAMLIVGRTRRKYNEIPVANEKMHLDGDIMVQDATRMQKDLIDVMERSRVDSPITWGV